MAKAAQSTKDTAKEPVQPVTEVMRVETYNPDALRAVSSFEDAVQLAVDTHGGVAEADKELGDGFTLLDSDDKARLVGVPCLFMEWSFHPGDFGDVFVAARVVARNPDGSAGKYIINDGSTGIKDVLAKYTDNTGRTGGLFARHGLRASEYQYCEACGKAAPRVGDDEHKAAGKHKKAATYYIDTSA
jgi:hypothetical protein